MDTRDARRRTWPARGSDARTPRTLQTLRVLLLVEAVSLLVAAALHAGIVIRGSFQPAAMYEASLGVILALALGLTVVAPGSAGWIGIAAQALTLAGASIGLYLALLGAAPNTPLDIVYHVALIAALVVGLVVAWRARAS